VAATDVEVEAPGTSAGAGSAELVDGVGSFVASAITGTGGTSKMPDNDSSEVDGECCVIAPTDNSDFSTGIDDTELAFEESRFSFDDGDAAELSFEVESTVDLTDVELDRDIVTGWKAETLEEGEKKAKIDEIKSGRAAELDSDEETNIPEDDDV